MPRPRMRRIRGFVDYLWLRVDVGRAVFLPAFGEEGRVLVRARAPAHQDATLLDARFVTLDPLFRNAPAHERADQSPGSTASASASDCSCQRACDNDTKSRDGDRRTDRGNRGADCGDPAADRATYAGAFGRLAAQLGLLSFGGAEMRLARFIG